MTPRALIVAGHRWVGLACSVVLGIAGLTGAAIVWPGPFPGRQFMVALHDSLALGRPGWFVVLAATAGSVVLLASGIYLWWKSKMLRVRTKSGLRNALIDLHYAVGAIGLLAMLVIAGSGVGRAVLPHSRTRDIVSKLHTARPFPAPIKVGYMAGSLAFFVQGVTGVVMWWKPARARRERT